MDELVKMDMSPEKWNFIWLNENNEQVFVSDGISQGRQWGTFRRKEKGKQMQAGGVYVGSLQRICSPALPMVGTKAEAQKMLNIWAEEKGYRLLCVFGRRLNCSNDFDLCCRYCGKWSICSGSCAQQFSCGVPRT